MNKFTYSIAIGCLVLSSALPQIASAAVVDVSHASKAITLIDNTLNFGAKFGNGLKDGSFVDNFTFSLTGSYQSEAIVSSISSRANNGLALTGFDLLNAQGLVLGQGVQQSTGIRDLWYIPTTSLQAGDYLLRVKGYVVSNTSGSFGGNVNVTPVPEPESYAMLGLGGLMLAMFARRRKLAMK